MYLLASKYIEALNWKKLIKFDEVPGDVVNSYLQEAVCGVLTPLFDKARKGTSSNFINLFQFKALVCSRAHVNAPRP